MTERKTYTAEELRALPGRRVTFDGVISRSQDVPFGYVRIEFPSPHLPADFALVRPSAIREILPPELKAGDRVKAILGGALGVILVIDGHRAGVRWDVCTLGHGWPHLSDLTLIEPAQ